MPRPKHHAVRERNIRHGSSVATRHQASSLLRVRTPAGTRTSRRAAAVVELAVCLPLLVLLTFASLEGANMLFLRQAVVQAAYEAAKAAAKSNGSQGHGTDLAEQVLGARRITQSTITFNPDNVDDLVPGTPFTVTISVPGDQRSVTGMGPFNGLAITAAATMLRE